MAEPAFRFYVLYDKICRADILAHAYALVRDNGEAPGVDGVTFSAIERLGLETWLAGLREDLVAKTYRPEPVRRVNLPKPGGGLRPLGIPTMAVNVSQTPNDKQQLAPILDMIAGLPGDIGRPDTLLADAGYFSAANVEACAKAGIDPLIAPGRDAHHPGVDERFVPAPPAPEDPTPLDTMLHRLTTPEGRALYARRKQTPEPVFGVIKSVFGFRQFSLRGLAGVRGEWSLVTLAWNVKRMFNLSGATA